MKGAHLSVASASIPKFALFDAPVELWKDYLARFTTFMGANSIPDEKIEQVFLTNQSTITYKLLCTVAGQQDPPEDINKLPTESINAFMEQEYDPQTFCGSKMVQVLVKHVEQTWGDSTGTCSKNTPGSCNLRFRLQKGSTG